jgi:hypothetical protein
MAIGSTQPLTEMSTRGISWRINECRAENLATPMFRLSRSSEILNLLRACPGLYMDIQNQIVYRPLKKGVVLDGIVN